MSKLFIANLTKQNQTFMYRVPEKDGGGGTRHQDIQIGSQVQIPGDLSDAQIDVIIEHHGVYGIKSVQEARDIKGFTGLVYSIGKPVELNEKGLVEEILESNDASLTERTGARREQTAAAIADRLGHIGAGSGAPLQRTEVEQVEETKGTPRVAAGVEAVAENVTPRNKGEQRAAR